MNYALSDKLDIEVQERPFLTHKLQTVDITVTIASDAHSILAAPKELERLAGTFDPVSSHRSVSLADSAR
jgi:hypothetical protein